MSRNIFGWDLPPGCSINDIERAAGGDDDYWTRQQMLADDEAGYQASREHDAWQVKVKGYFKWREALMYDEDDGYIRFADEDAERRGQFGITDEDERQWETRQAASDLPF